MKITAPRGYVLDRHGAPLVENEPAYTLHLYRREARDLEASIDFAVGAPGPVPRGGRLARGARPEGAGVPPDSDRREPRHRGSRGDRGTGDRAPRVCDHRVAAPALQARGLGGPRARIPRRGDAGADQGRRRRLPGRRLDRTERRRERLPAAPGRGQWRTPRDRGFPRPRGVGSQPPRGHAGTEPLPDARPEAPGGRRGLLQGPRRHGRRHGSEDRRDPRPRVLALLRSQLVHAARDLFGMDGPDREPGPAAAEPDDPEHVLAGVGLQDLPRVRRPRAQRRRSGGPDLLSRPRRLLRTGVPLPQEGRAWLGQPARRDQGVLRRVLLQPRPAPRDRPHQRGRDVVRVRPADRSRPGVREVGPRSVRRVGEDPPRRALVSQRDHLGRRSGRDRCS